MMLWNAWKWHQPALYLVPVGLSVIGFVELLKREIPQAAHNPLRYVGALTILASPGMEIIRGSWVHMLALLVLSVLLIVLAIGLRVRSLIYMGSSFLALDLISMVVHSTIANPILLWVGGVALGLTVIAVAAACENHREKLLSQIRFLSAELATWN